jgi:hypothetical protein
MVSLTSLAIPILVSAVLVFVASALIHMVLGYHRNDVRRLADEDGVLDALRRLDIRPGDYAAPHAGSAQGMKEPQFAEKMRKGPLVLMTIARGEEPSMAKSLSLWFLYTILVSLLTAYAASLVLPPGTAYRAVFRVVSTVAFMGYSLALLQHSIWYRRSWATTVRSVFDGFVFALLTAGTFGWLWPR